MKLKKIAALLLAVVMLALIGCSGDKPDSDSHGSTGENSAPAEAKGSLTLLYCSNDTINPYKTISKLNAELGLLLFEPLMKVDNQFNAISALADTATVEGTVCTVTLKNVLFSDGSPLTASDVVFSYNLAKNSSRYSSLLYEVVSVYEGDEKSIIFNLSRHDTYFASLLTFPILKQGSDGLKNEDNIELVPIGCGRFVFGDDGTVLMPNEKYYGGSTNVTKINLINAPDNESMEHYVEVGATDLYYADPSFENIIRMSGKKTSVNINNMVYIGINHNYGPLKDANLRYAISSAVDRTEIATTAFYTNALPATGFYHPLWEVAARYQTLPISADKKISVENLEEIGYNSLDVSGYRVNSAGKPLTLTLLVNSDSPSKLSAANLICEQLKAVGIKLVVNSLPTDRYFSSLQSGSFQLYLGEVKLLPNMDLGPLVLAGGSAAYGMINAAPQTENEAFNDETSYISVMQGLFAGTNTVTDSAPALLASMPVVPLVYRSSVVFYSDKIKDFGNVSAFDLFIALDELKF